MDSQETINQIPAFATKAEIFARLEELGKDAANTNKQELDLLKQNFYKQHKAQQENEKKEFIEAGGNEAEFVSALTADEDKFKELMGVIKEARFAMHQELEMKKQMNYVKCLALIDRLKTLLESPEEVGKSYNAFKEINQEWNEAKPIPEDKANDIWKSYQMYREQFYDLLKLNHEMREYDFKKNLEMKNALIEKAEALGKLDDAISAFHQLQNLHQQYREIGPVAKELREDVWARFKAASTVVNKRHQEHFEKIREKENNNLELKTALCEKVEAIAESASTTTAEWNEKAQQIIDIQKEWRSIGFAPQKMNQKIFDRFRAACDKFFTERANQFKQFKQGLQANLEKKIALCEKAEALKESTDWNATSKILSDLQKEWKTIGAVPRKNADAVWKRFNEACDFFFENKNKANAGAAEEQKQNLEKKLAIIEKLREAKENVANGIEISVKDMVAEWNSIGHVPFREKDKIYEEFRSLVDFLFKELSASTMQRRLNGFKEGLKNKKEGSRNERQRLIRKFEALRSEIQTYENNLGFISMNSKKANSLTNEIERKIERQKGELELIRQQIAAIDEN